MSIPLTADFVFNIAKGRIAELYNRVDTNDPANSALIGGRRGPSRTPRSGTSTPSPPSQAPA